MKTKSCLFLIILIFLIGCGANDQATETNGRYFDIEPKTIDEMTSYEPSDVLLNADYKSATYIQIADTTLKLKDATISDFIEAGAHFQDEDITSEEILEWTMNANQMETIVYIGDSYELTLNRADYGEEKLIGDCVVGDVEIRFKDVDVLSTDINSLPVCNCIQVNAGVRFGAIADEIEPRLGTADSRFDADYDYTVIEELNYDNDYDHVLSCQIKDGRIFCLIIKGIGE